MRILIAAFLSLVITSAFSQKKITVEAIWKDYAFYSNSVPGFNFMNDGSSYTRLDKNVIKSYDLITGELKSEILNAAALMEEGAFNGKVASYSFNTDESLILISSESEPIFRHSSKSFFYLYNRAESALIAIDKGAKISNATLSPLGDKVAYVKENNLYYYDITKDQIIQVTRDGKNNHIINGMCDWVYEEEFGFTKAFEWSPKGEELAFMRFDESMVPEFTMMTYNDDAYPEYTTFKYPKVGEKNAEVSVHIYDLEDMKTIKVNRDESFEYVPRIKWTLDEEYLCVFNMNRHQNHLQLLLADEDSGETKLLMEEKNKYYIDITDDFTFLEDQKHFIWSSEKDGYNHLYLYDMKGREKQLLTKGDYDVSRFYGVDQKNQRIYYQASKVDPSQKEVYSVSYNGKDEKKHSKFEGVNSAQFSSTFDYYVLNHSTANTASNYTVFDSQDRAIRTIESNDGIKELQKEYNVQPISFFDFKTSEEVSLNGWMIKPADFDANKQYPVFMYLYGGPGSQQVTDGWKGQNYWWFQMLAQQGYIVACVDNRGTGARGEEFKKMTYQQLGHYETIDQIEAAKYLGALPYTDAARIGIFGWSYGGYMSSLCLFKGNDVFKSAIAVAPVTNWKWYDSIYTERYMRTSEENPEGYQNNSPVYFSDQLKGNYLLIHGEADDNVHIQNSMEMSKALIKANKQFDFYVYPNRNHSIYGDNARLHLYTKMTSFILEKL